MRRRLAVLLCLVLAAASAFASGSTEAAAPEGTGSYKIGIITELASVMEETYKAAERLAEKYPDVVVHLTYPENTATEIETTISTVLSLAYDEDVKAIVFCSGVLGTAAAIEKVKEIRPDILTIVGVPVEDVEVTCAAADLSHSGRMSLRWACRSSMLRKRWAARQLSTIHLPAICLRRLSKPEQMQWSRELERSD